MCGSSGTNGYYITYPRINEDFIANLGISDPTKFKFYGICMASCPVQYQVVCNSEAPVCETGGPLPCYPALTYPTLVGTTTQQAFSKFTNTQLLACVADGNSAGAGTTSCSEINANCWITPQVTTSIMYR